MALRGGGGGRGRGRSRQFSEFEASTFQNKATQRNPVKKGKERKKEEKGNGKRRGRGRGEEAIKPTRKTAKKIQLSADHYQQ